MEKGGAKAFTFKEPYAIIAKKRIHRAAVIATFIIIVIASAALLNTTIVYVYVEGELKTTHLTLGEEDLKLHFNSSITGTPVTIHFKIAHGKIRGHNLEADEAMIEYYSMGILEVSTAVKGYESRNMEFCSTQNYKLIIGDRRIELENTCVKVEVRSALSLIKRNG